jgi:hypothetical protein
MECVMIELDDRIGSDFLTIRLRGLQSTSEFSSFGDSLAGLTGGRAALRILFDWSALEGWDPKDEVARSCRNWKKGSLVIERLAIVHEHHWNRQAALLAAVLRGEASLVRSWASRDLSQAVAWLREAPPRP